MQEEDLLKIAITFDHWEGDTLVGYDNNKAVRCIALPQGRCYQELKNILHKGCCINSLSNQLDSEGTLHPKDIIFEPDYLIEISSLSRCMQPYGSPAIGYILNFFEKNEESAARLLGEAANMFLDDCANESSDSPATYKGSVAKFFREYPLQLSSCENIDKEFFEQLHRQFCNIQMKVGNIGIESEKGYRRDNIQLEPSFFCEALGLQGRIDLLQSDCSHLIELKAGKADEFRGGPKEEHKLQMSLYKEMLCYNLRLPRNHIHTHLFYSRYPRFYSIESGEQIISLALMLRNKIVALLLQLGEDGLRNVLTSITPDDLNEYNTTSRLWTLYKRPAFEEILTPFKESDALLLDYFFGNLSFVAREMLLAKKGDNTREGSRSFSDVWRATVESKQSNGNILIGLEIKQFNDEEEGISDITLRIPEYSNDFFPNFRAGDTVFIYRRDTESDTAINRQVTRGTITHITPDSVTLHLRHKQRNRIIFPIQSRYAIEHDHMDSTFRATFRDLYSLLTAPLPRVELLLSQRQPRFDRTLTLTRDYGNKYINEIVLKAKQAEELFMLVGPPGTGKTSQALSSMVREFNDGKSDILIVSYTNRAVDEICQTLERLPEKPEYIRIGSEQSCAQQYRHRLLKNVISHCQKRDEIHNVIKNTHIIVGTIASLTSRKELYRMKRFSTAIIDEASQILESQFAGLIAATTPTGESAIGKFIMIGDTKQLPAVVTQPARLSQVKSERLLSAGITDYSMSLFERLYQWYFKHPVEGITATLNRQGRMHPVVGNFANKHFYAGELNCVPLPHQCEELPYKIFDHSNIYQRTLANRRTAFIVTEKNKEERPKSNKAEAQAIAEFVKAHYELCKANNIECILSEDIGVIVPFRNQIAMVMNEIAKLQLPHCEDIIIDTVERFQGSQKDTILFGTTITTAEEITMLSSIATDTDGNSIDRKLNVALTRARKQMFVFGNPEALSASPLYRTLIEELNN